MSTSKSSSSSSSSPASSLTSRAPSGSGSGSGSKSKSSTGSKSKNPSTPSASASVSVPSSASTLQSESTQEKPQRRRFDPPSSAIHAFFWRRMIWLNVTFPGYMLESWEVVFLTIIFTAIFLLLLTGIIRWVPAQIIFVADRYRFYIFGQESKAAMDAAAAAAVGEIHNTAGKGWGDL